jgi:UDP-perosamine 4-acetyltransferase
VSVVPESIGPPLILLGAGGHAKVLLALALSAGHKVTGICDPHLAGTGVRVWRGIAVLGGDDALDELDPRVYGLVNGIGPMPRQDDRRRIYEACREKGFMFPAMVHPFSWVAAGVRLLDGVQVMGGAVIQPDCSIGSNTTVNTGASIDHDCSIGAHVHVAPGATLCGGVSLADGVYVGAGATVIHGISVGSGAVVGAGVPCVRNVAPGELLICAPVRRKKS